MLHKLLRALSRPESQPAAIIQPSFRHEDTALTLAETAVDRRFDMAYRKTYDFPGEDIDSSHRWLGECPTREGMIDIGIDGRLLPADARKLYELAYFCGGDMLELGAFRALSTSLMALAMTNAHRRDAIFSVDLAPEAVARSRATMKGRPGGERVSFLQMDGDAALAKLIGARKRFRFASIGHSHRYEPVRSAAELLPRVLEPGAFVLFHDYNDCRNPMADNDDYGVYQGVRDGLSQARFQFWGIYGCTGLFRFKG